LPLRSADAAGAEVAALRSLIVTINAWNTAAVTGACLSP
jgi:hypothetical protein